MNEKEFKIFLDDYKEEISWGRIEDDLGAIYLKSDIWDTIIRIDLKVLHKLTPELILRSLEAGKNVQQMTRVTGFFSAVSNWNKGKLGELRDRYRIKGLEDKGGKSE